ncbi:quinone oxidoreductase PIG3 [Hydra vulgaris]|uniref:Quinone oxidoreductase PIG3 n=1 Tax=Hydra vulgaris TaxID=6087 RepID=A0ABM4DNB7_HYDVU
MNKLFSHFKIFYNPKSLKNFKFKSTMQAVLVNDSKMFIENVEKVKLKLPRDILVKVEATSINRADILQRKGLYPPPNGESRILGLEASGIVVETGVGCQKFRVGDCVAGILSGGGYAEYVCSDERNFFKVPNAMSLISAAAIPEVWITAYQLIHTISNSQAGDTILVHAAGSGVGTAAVQLAKHAKLTVYTTAGSESKLEKIKQLGGDVMINYKDQKFDEIILKRTQGNGVNVILDCVGGSYISQNLNSLAMDGKWILYGFLGGHNVESKFLLKLFAKRAQLTATTLRTRSIEYKGELIKSLENDILPYFGTGKLNPIIDKVLDWTNVNEAHAYMESNQSFGKIILKIS